MHLNLLRGSKQGDSRRTSTSSQEVADHSRRTSRRYSTFKCFPVWTQIWLALGFLFPRVFSASNLPLLSGTLRTFQVHACDGDDLRIECWPNTVINIYLAQYGRHAPSYQLCPQEESPHRDVAKTVVNETTNCLASEALRTVEQACREQQICKVKTAPSTFSNVDPCPGVRKYAEVAYKCRPNTFSNTVVCEGDRLRLRCHRNLRIVIYSASFGATHYGAPECPQPKGEGEIEDCQVSYATEAVMSSCHGRRKCSIGADVGTFGSPGCPQGTKLFLKVVHTCVPREVLKELDLGGNEESDKDQEDSDYTGFIEEPRYVPPATASPSGDASMPVNKLSPTLRAQPDGELKDVMIEGGQTTVKTDMQSDENNSVEDGDASTTKQKGEKKVIGFLSEWVSAFNFIKDNKEKFILYLSLGLSVAVVACLAILTVKMYIRKSRQRRERSKPPIPPSSPASGGGISPFGDDCIDLEHFDNPARLEDSGVEVVRYASRSSLKRSIPLDEDETNLPRAPVRALNNYYYS